MSGILALDQATITGFAFAEPGCEPLWGHLRLAPRGSDQSSIGVGLNRFLRRCVEQFRPDEIIYENPFIGLPLNPETIFLLGGLAMLIGVFAKESGIRCWKQETRAAVKLLTGKGKFHGRTPAERRKAKKLATMQACWARGWKATEDEADALALLMFAEFKLYPEAARQRRMVLKMPSGPLFHLGRNSAENPQNAAVDCP